MDTNKKSADEVGAEMLAAQAQARPSVAPVAAPGGRPAPEASVPEPPEGKSGRHGKGKKKPADDEDASAAEQ